MNFRLNLSDDSAAGIIRGRGLFEKTGFRVRGLFEGRAYLSAGLNRRNTVVIKENIQIIVLFLTFAWPRKSS